MVKGIVKTNKANDTKYIYLSKDCGFNNGQEVDIKFRGIGIYNKEKLKEYFNQNKDMFLEIKRKIQEIDEEVWTNKFYKYAKIIGKYFEYGKLEWGDEFYFEKNNEYSTSPEGDIQGGYLDCFDFRVDDFEEIIKERKLDKNKIKKELIDFMNILFLKNKSEEAIEESHKREVDMMKEFGFENKEDKNYSGYETTLYSNGTVQLWYDVEDWAYNKTLSISTMKQIDTYSKESNIEF